MTDATVLGLRDVGSALARCLVRSGPSTTVWNRTAARALETSAAQEGLAYVQAILDTPLNRDEAIQVEVWRVTSVYVSRERSHSRTAIALALGGLLCWLPAIASGANQGGTMEGRWKPGGREDRESVPVTFSFHREEAGSGRISLLLGSGGKRYVGSYLRLTGARPLARIRVFYTYWVSDAFDGYSEGPRGAAFDRRITIEQFQRRYTGAVIANLIGQAGGGMRCLFELDAPDGGLANGANGSCQSSDGGVVDLVRLPKTPAKS